jgi:hypothetical protein
LVAWSRYIANGTRIRPPRDSPEAFSPTTVARLRRNHLESNAPVLVRETPLMAVALRKPNMKTRKRKWKVRLSNTVARPKTIRLVKITFRPPNRSRTCPRKGWVSPLTRNPREAAREIVPRFQPNSCSMGRTKMPKLLRAPLVTRAMNMQAPTMYQP